MSNLRAREQDADSSVNIPDQSSMQDANEEEYFTFQNNNGKVKGKANANNSSMFDDNRQSVDYIAKLQKVNCDFSALNRMHRPRKFKKDQ